MALRDQRALSMALIYQMALVDDRERPQGYKNQGKQGSREMTQLRVGQEQYDVRSCCHVTLVDSKFCWVFLLTLLLRPARLASLPSSLTSPSLSSLTSSPLSSLTPPPLSSFTLLPLPYLTWKIFSTGTSLGLRHI